MTLIFICLINSLKGICHVNIALVPMHATDFAKPWQKSWQIFPWFQMWISPSYADSHLKLCDVAWGNSCVFRDGIRMDSVLKSA